MHRFVRKGRIFLLACLCSTLLGFGTHAQEMPADYQEVLKSLDRKGDFKAGVLKVNIPRNDLKMMIQGVSMPTPFGFGGWVAMTKGTDGTDVMMGDLVLLQEEVNPVMSALLDNGIEVTALHNHFFWDDPHVYFMHVHGMGKAADLAKRIKPGLDLIGHGPAAATAAASSGSAATLDTAKNAKIVGHEGEQSGAVYKITVGRDDLNMKEHGAAINARMGLNTWAAFVGTDESGPGVETHARIDGRAVFLHIEVVSAHGNLVNRARLLAFMSHDLRVFGCVQSCRRTTACCSGGGCRPMPDQVQPWFNPLGKIRRFSHPMNVHEINVRVIPKEMVVERSHFDTVVQEGGHDWIHLFLEQHQIAHHHLGTVCAFRHGNPSSETERRRRGYALNRHFQVVAWDVDLEHPCLEIPFSIEGFQHFLIVGRHLLRVSSEAEQRRAQTSQKKYPALPNKTVHMSSPFPSLTFNVQFGWWRTNSYSAS